MRLFTAATAARFASRSAFSGQVLVWLEARHRGTGATEGVGFWSGDDHAEFTIDGQTRTYYGAGAFLGMDPIRRQLGIKTRTQRVRFSHISPAGMALIRTYDPRHAPIEIHRALYDPLTGNLIDEPHVLIRGFVDKAPSRRAPKGQGGEITVEIATHARALTRALSRYRSDATMQARAPGDGIRKYASIAETVDTPWGRHAASGSNSGGGGAPWAPGRNSAGADGGSGAAAGGGGSWLRR